VIFRRRFEVAAPLAAVEEFHARPAGLVALTPPPLWLRFAAPPPDPLTPGDELVFTLWAGPLPVRWRARIEALDGPGPGFQDRQLAGPFALWVHRHRFRAVGDPETGPTEIDDEIEARLRRHPFWGLVGLKMWLGLPLLFAYRRWKTRRLLVGGAETAGGVESAGRVDPPARGGGSR
jgi:ligand-binding SRPBCC domain-containing protein